MSRFKRIQGVYEGARRLHADSNTRMVFMSDCHRGTGSGADNFAHNQNLFYVALSHYDRDGFTYIEIGDGDELWENKEFPAIATEYDHIFAMLRKLYKQQRFYMMWGNHDAVKRKERWVGRNLSQYQDHRRLGYHALFPGIRVEEGILIQLKGKLQNREILLLHGHQADFFNDRLHLLSQFLVRHIWRPLELVGIRDPMNASTNPSRRIKVERLLAQWSDRRRTMLVAGHTHRPIFPDLGDSLYFNDGSGVHPRFITAIELENSSLSLVKWEVKAGEDGVLRVTREILEGPVPVEDFYAMREA